MKDGKKFYLISLLYPTIDGFVSFILPRKLVSISRQDIGLMSARYFTGFFTDLLIFRKFCTERCKSVLMVAFLALFLSLLFLLPGSLLFILLSLVLYGIVDITFWSAATGYLERMTDNLEKDLELFSFFTLLGYFLSIINLLFYLFFHKLVFLVLFGIVGALIVLGRLLVPDKLVTCQQVTLNRKNLKKYVLVFLSAFLFFCWLSTYFIILPSILKLLGISFLVSALIFAGFNLSRALAGLVYARIIRHLPKKFRSSYKLAYFLAACGAFTAAALLAKNIYFIFVCTLAAAAIFMLAYNEWFEEMNGKFPALCHSGEIGVFVTMGSELAFCVTPLVTAALGKLVDLQFVLYPILLIIILHILLFNK
ncbi:MAG: hypothetical protein GXO42_02090 [bacterium]|nr:hypothetical protein [bacterium]